MLDVAAYIVLGVLLLAVLAVQVLLWRRMRGIGAVGGREDMLAERTQQIHTAVAGLQQTLDRHDRILREEFAASRKEATEISRQQREEAANALKSLTDSLLKRMADLAQLQGQQFDNFSRNLRQLIESNEKKLEQLRLTVEQQLKALQEDNSKKLDEMRKTVDEKLQGTLEKRLGESFRQVSERLEQVHKGLGEMQQLANGVGDLKRVMTNVKTRGIWGEYQLGNLLEQFLTPDQYEQNVATKPGSDARVEFAIRMPGSGDEGSIVYMPIDAKFPQEDYQRLVDATQTADPEAVDAAVKQLDNAIRKSAKDISEKYIAPPHTTNFAIMFLPTEGLYAEVARRPGMIDQLQRDYRVTLAGPTNLVAMLNALHMGFRTLAIEKRSEEVWRLLAEVKGEFSRFGEVIARVKKQLGTVANTIEKTEQRTRAMGRKLKKVEQLPTDATATDQPALPLVESKSEE